MSEKSICIQVEGYEEIQARVGERLVLALERGGVDILHRCGGISRCTTCRVSFTEGEPEQMTVAERDQLANKGLLGHARLSCQMTCIQDMSLKPLQTTKNSDLEAGKIPQEHIEPKPEWINTTEATLSKM